MESLVHLDRSLTLWLNQANPTALNGFWHFMSAIKVWIPLYAAILVFLFFRLGWKKALVVTLTLILGLVLTDQLANLVKNGVMRPRPCRDDWMIAHGVLCPDGLIGGLYGFFSGHSANTFAFAAGSWAALGLNDRKHSYGWYGGILMCWAALVALSRVMLAAHYLGDIVAGCAAGLILGYALAYAMHRLILKVRL